MKYEEIKQELIKEETYKLLQPSNEVTTLEVKQSLITTHPSFYWNQKDVSTFLNSLISEGDLFVSKDSGTFRVYSSHKWLKSPKKIQDLLEKSKGKFITVCFTKKSGDERIMNCKFVKLSTHPYAHVIETKTKEIKNVNLSTLKWIACDGKIHTL